VRNCARLVKIGLLSVVHLGTLSAQRPTTDVYDRVVLGGRVIDPASNLDAVRNIGLRDGRIAVITTDAIRGGDTVDAHGLVVAPGFIDIHAHGQTPKTYRFQSLDGVTTSLELELGTSDVDAWYRERSAGERINYGVSVGHIKVRMAVMHDSGGVMPVSDGAYRAASPAQIAEIGRRIGSGLGQGAVSVGAGFPYTPAATREELLTVFRVAASTKTPVHVHIRPGIVGLREALALAGETNAPLHVVHINSAGLAETPTMLEMIREARARGRDVTTEAYPYSAGMTEIQSATIQDVYRSASNERFAELEWPSTGERLNRASFDRYRQVGGPVVIHTNTEPMVAAAINSPLTIVASDAYWQNGRGHPRTTGTFSRVLGRYVREAHTLSLMDAIRKMTLMPAQRLEARVPAMQQKGRVRVGGDADITIFDAATVADRSTYREPSLPPVGIRHVIVNGVSVVRNGDAVEGVAPGKAIRAPIAPEVLLRLDDVGMNHSVNLAIEKVAATGMPFSVSVLFACPWYQEAVEILKRNPQVAVGVHLALNAEWRGYRWGPVLGRGGVPSLVDSVGYFLPSRDAFLNSNFDLGEVERELSAQVERALASGLRISYVDAHMGMAEATPELREVEERVARRYGLGISTYFGESYFSLWGVPVASKKATLLAHLGDAKRDTVNLIEVHVAERTPEMEVIFDMNAPSQNSPEAGVVAHRKAELETMLSSELAELVRSGKIRLVTYQQVVARDGLAVMRRPRD
jgi:predicted glycoside hydrolase/deacetylase ChbG (UPF0249 family)/imidazolonepropionase-like amidohydrolase